MQTGLTIAGSDSGGGAGIQADIKALEANGVYAASAITAVTAQNTLQVRAAQLMPTELVEEQIDAVADDISIDVVKIGMLGSAPIIEAVARRLRSHALGSVVLDPVMVSKTGYTLLDPGAVDALRREMLPLATLLTPNAYEAGKLADVRVDSVEAAERAARAIGAMGPAAVLVKGGHMIEGEHAIDTLFDGSRVQTFSAPAIDTRHTHGTGCTYASAIAAFLARGFELGQGITRAKEYVTEAIRHARPLGSGRGPTNHFYFHALRP